MEAKGLTIAITGAAGHIACAFYILLGSGQVFGERTPIRLKLLELPEKIPDLKGIQMQLEDCAFTVIESIEITADPAVAFKDIDLGIFLGGQARKPGMERSDLLQLNNAIFKSQGSFLNQYAKPTAKILVVANPSNTNCLTLAENCPNIPKKNFTSLMQLDQNRCVAMLAKRANASIDNVQNIVVWGNHSLTQFPDVTNATINGVLASDIIQDQDFIQVQFVSQAQKRGSQILQVSKGTSFISAANAVKDHLRIWYRGTKEGEWTTFGVITTGKHYGIPSGYCYAFPVKCKDFEYEVVDNLPITDFVKQKMEISFQELKREKEEAEIE